MSLERTYVGGIDCGEVANHPCFHGVADRLDTTITEGGEHPGVVAPPTAGIAEGLETGQPGRRALVNLAAVDHLHRTQTSRSGNFGSALQALEMAITLNRRVENSWGLANDWRAMGDVQKRAGNHEAASDAYTRSAGIFHALGFDDASEETLSRIDGR